MSTREPYMTGSNDVTTVAQIYGLLPYRFVYRSGLSAEVPTMWEEAVAVEGNGSVIETFCRTWPVHRPGFRLDAWLSIGF